MKKEVGWVFLSIFFFKLFSEFYLQKLTMMRIPDKGICYLMPLPKELSTPDKLIGDLEKASRVRISGFLHSTRCSSHCFISEFTQQHGRGKNTADLA